MSMLNEASRRRIFIKSQDRLVQVFTFDQQKDGSIYCASPDFDDAKWITCRITESGPEMIVDEGIGEGKVIFHGSGIVAVRPHSDTSGHRLRIKGNYLLKAADRVAGARHLFTVFLSEPKYEPSTSPAFNRASDYCLEAKEDLKPVVLVFFAIPRQGLTINFQFNLHLDEMVNIPNDLLGLHGFPLRHHDVYWFAYRTKHMEKWPKKAQVAYHDGFSFPIFIGTGIGVYRLEFRQPKYRLHGKELEIHCLGDYPDM